jgi:hypothetical protein
MYLICIFLFDTIDLPMHKVLAVRFVNCERISDERGDRTASVA